MKRKVGIVLGFLLIPVIMSFGAGQTAKGGAEAKKQFVGISFPSTLVDRWLKESVILKNELEKLGYRAEIQYANEDESLQIRQCENFLSQGIDLLVVCAVDTVSAATIVEAAHAENVPVIAYCRLIMNADIDGFVAEDNDQVGVMQGKFMAETLPRGNIILLGGSPQDSNGQLYHRKALEAIQSKIDSGDYKIVADQFCNSWSPDEAMKHTENALTQSGNNVQGVICNNDGTAGGAIEALAAQGLAGKVIVTGGDGELAAVKRIMAGTQTMTIFKDPVLIAGTAVKMLDALLNSRTPVYNGTMDNGFKKVPACIVDMVTITKDNVKAKMIDTGFYTQEQLNQ
jgi:D-xylose transport system substrate-binding protein